MIAKLLMALTVALNAFGTPGATSDFVPFGDHYLAVDDGGFLTMWAESNGQPGLQMTPVVIMGIVVAQPDHRIHV